jgi:kynurenine formamidase
MCSPQVAKVVQNRIAQEGLHKVSRRNFLKFGGMSAAGLAIAQAGLSVNRAQAQGGMNVLDLSYVFGTVMPTYLLGETPTREDFVTVENDGFYIQRWNFTEHAGTHMDLPAHFVSGATTTDNYDPALLIATAAVIDIREKAAADPDAMVELADVEAYESSMMEIPAGAVVFMNSGWGAKWSSIEDFRNADADGVMHFPGFSAEAVEFLLTERGINGIGVDTLSLDPGNSSTFDVHVMICSAGAYGIEGVANLDALMEMRGAWVVAGLPRWEEGSGGPCRLLAVSMGM